MHGWLAGRLQALAVLVMLLGALPVALNAGPAAAQPADRPDRPDPELRPPLESRAAFVDYMVEARGEEPEMLRRRWTLAQALIRTGDLVGGRAITAFLLAPRHIFARVDSPRRAYQDTPLDIGYGQTISAPHMVARMTSELDVAPGDRVLEIGTGSGYQAAVLAHLTDQVYSIEIVEPLAARTEALLADLIDQGYDAYADIRLREGDGYYGWPEEAPFDRIIVTAAIDHIPPPLLRQLSIGGTMLIPVGPPMAQVLLEVEKIEQPGGTIEIARRDVYEGRGRVAFVPMTRSDGRSWSR